MRRFVLLLCLAVAPAAVAKNLIKPHRLHVPAPIKNGTYFHRQGGKGTQHLQPAYVQKMTGPDKGTYREIKGGSYKVRTRHSKAASVYSRGGSKRKPVIVASGSKRKPVVIVAKRRHR